MVKDTNLVRCWGLDNNGQVPVWVTPPSDLGAVSKLFAYNTQNCAVVKATGLMRCWGLEDSDRLAFPSDLGNVTAVGLGDTHGCAADAAGQVRCWGTSDMNANVVPSGLGAISEITANDFMTCAGFRVSRG